MAPLAFVAATTTAVTPGNAAPTTTAQFCLFNGELPGGKTYYITSVSASTTTSAAATENAQLFLHVSAIPLANIPSITAAAGPKSMGGGANAGTLAKVGSAAGTIVNDGIWHPVGESRNTGTGTATIALGVWANVTGIYQIPPGGMLSLAFVTSTAAGACKSYVTWVEQ